MFFSRHIRVNLLPKLAFFPLLRNQWLPLGIAAKRTEMRIERTITQLLLFILGDSQDILEKFGVSSFTLTGISHLSHLLHKLSDRLAVFEWAAFFECRALASQTFILLYEAGIWTDILAKSGTFEHRIVQSDAHWSLKPKK